MDHILEGVLGDGRFVHQGDPDIGSARVVARGVGPVHVDERSVELQRRHGLAYLFISHDLRVVRALAHKVIVMKQGDIVEEGNGQVIFDAPQTAYTGELMAAAFGGHSPAGPS